jgi:hypothetical protein
LNPALADAILRQEFLLIDEQVEQMRDKGIFLDMTPTFDDFFYLKVTEPSIVISPASSADAVSRNRRRKQQYDQLVQRVLKSGVKFAAGSDMCWFYPGKSRGQASVGTLIKLRDAGVPPLDVIQCCRNAGLAGPDWHY